MTMTTTPTMTAVTKEVEETTSVVRGRLTPIVMAALIGGQLRMAVACRAARRSGAGAQGTDPSRLLECNADPRKMPRWAFPTDKQGAAAGREGVGTPETNSGKGRGLTLLLGPLAALSQRFHPTHIRNISDGEKI